MIKNHISTIKAASSIPCSGKPYLYQVGDSVLFNGQVMDIIGLVNNDILYLDYLSNPLDVIRTTVLEVTPIPITMEILAQNFFVQKLDGIFVKDIEDVSITYFVENRGVFARSSRCDLHVKNISNVHELQQILRVLDLKFWDDFTLYKS